MSVSTPKSTVYKKTVLRFGVGFFIAMLLLTFFSGTLNNIALAKVGVAAPSSASLQKVITADGAFAAKDTVDVTPEAAGKVSEVLVKTGDVVKAGDTLVKMDMSALQGQIKNEQSTLTKMLNNRKRSQLTVAPDYTQQTVALNKAWQAYTQARDAYDALTASGTATPEQLDEAKQKKTDTYNDYKVKKAALNQQKKQDANQKKSSALELANTDIDIQAQRDKIADLEEQVKNNTEIKAPVDGRIQTVNVEAGAEAGTAQPLLTMLDTQKGLEFTFDVSNDNAELMAAGDRLDIHLQGSQQRVMGTLRELKNSTQNPGQMMTVYLDADTAGVLENDVQPNQKGDIRFSVDTASYGTTLPNDAVREDGSGYFVLVVQQKRTPLGNSLVLARVDVAVVDSDSYRTAVSGALSPRDQVVVSSDKSVADGDTVRLAS